MRLRTNIQWDTTRLNQLSKVTKLQVFSLKVEVQMLADAIGFELPKRDTSAL